MLSVKALDKFLRLRSFFSCTSIPIMSNLEEPAVFGKLSRFGGDKVKMFSSNPCMIRENGTGIGDCWVEGSSLHSPKNSNC